ncbi:response regulator [Sagittula sp. S175]|uniref:response regulator n=1 Tax=Sagittula sp. S175 TaxID=3415129 RepID=UPI003C7981A4
MTGSSRRVWLIDDSEIDQRLYRRIISRAGVIWEVEMFTFADEALARLKADPGQTIDLIFLDINMPRMNGFEFLEAATAELGTAFAKVVVAMLTTSLDPADHERARTFSMVKDFITKPLTPEIVKSVERLFDDSG